MAWRFGFVILGLTAFVLGVLQAKAASADKQKLQETLTQVRLDSSFLSGQVTTLGQVVTSFAKSGSSKDLSAALIAIAASLGRSERNGRIATDTLAGGRTQAKEELKEAEDRLTYRQFTADQKANLIRRFSSYRQVPVQIEVVNPDEESEGLARGIQSVLPLAKISKFSSSVRFKGIQVIEFGGSNHFENSIAGALQTELSSLFADVAPHRRTEPDWGQRSNVSGDFFEAPYRVLVLLAVGKRQ